MRGDFFQRLRDWSQHADAILAIGVIAIILLIVVPLPPILLDAFICFSIVFSVITLLLTLYVENALEFNAFPSLVLFLTLFRLGLNIASTRMILTRAEGGDIIQTFGEFVTEGNTLVGIILFALVTIINFIVISKGAGRIAEVAARFTLEGLGGKQASIENELTAGILTSHEAKKERERIVEETDFYGAMDGASKFVKGDAIASILIIFVNIVGGFIIGIAVKGMSWEASWNTFTRLTIGDGLVSQIPALLISLGAAIMVTRASKGSLGKLLSKQIFQHPKVLLITASVVLLLSIVPGMPIFVMLPIGVCLFFFGVHKIRKGEKKQEEKKEKSSILFMPPLEVQLGLNAVSLAESLYEKLSEIRRKVAGHLGIVVPKVHITDNVELPLNGWKILIKGITVAFGREADCHMLSMRLTEAIENHAHELINRQDVLHMVQEVKRVDSAVVEELIPQKLSIGHILRILQNLLKEKIPIRDFVTIMEVLADHASGEKNPDLDVLSEKVRRGLAKGISEKFFGKAKIAHVIMLDPKIEQSLEASNGKMRPKVIDQLLKELMRYSTEASKNGLCAVVVTASASRVKLKKIIECNLPELAVFSYQEISSDIEMKKIGSISNEILM